MTKFWQTRFQKRPKMIENFQIGYTFSRKIPEPVEGKVILGAPPPKSLSAVFGQTFSDWPIDHTASHGSPVEVAVDRNKLTDPLKFY